MDELGRVSWLRAECPLPDPARLSPLRERLLASIELTQPSPARARARLVLRTAVAVAVGGAVAVAVIGFRPAATRPAPAVTQHPVTQRPPAVARRVPVAPQRISLAKEVLRAAALSAASQPSSEPRASQWIYTKMVGYNLGSKPVTNEGWMTFDGGSEAYEQGGQLIVHAEPNSPPNDGSTPLAAYDRDATPLTAYEALASLPRDPTALLAAIDADTTSIAGSGWDPARGHATRAQWEFGYLAQLLWNAAQAAPPAAEAAVFHALAALPGVSAERDVLDAAGRPAIALSVDGVSQQLLLDPRTYQVTGQRTISDGTWPKAPTRPSSATWPEGTYLGGLAWETVTFVDGPGER